MEDNFRNVLIIISAIVIIAIFIHGLWTIRKQKNPYKLKTTKDKVGPLSRDFDKTGFDQDGVSIAKVTKLDETSQFHRNNIKGKSTNNRSDELPLGQSQVIHTKDSLSNTSEIDINDSTELTQLKDHDDLSNLDSSVEPDWFKDDAELQAKQEVDIGSVDTDTPLASFSKEELGDDLTLTSGNNQQVSQPIAQGLQQTEAVANKTIEPLYEQPVTQAKPARPPVKKIKKSPTKAELKRDQIEIDFDNPVADKPTSPNDDLNASAQSTSLEPEVIILSVVMPANQQMFGAALLPSLLTLGLKYGDMNIFHRHEDNAGNGKVTFSLANILNPGTFDLDSMENFATRGVSLFMTLPNAGNSLTVFEQMLNAAKQLAQEFNAQVLDESRHVLTKQSEQHYFSKIREFDRKSRITMVE